MEELEANDAQGCTDDSAARLQGQSSPTRRVLLIDERLPCLTIDDLGAVKRLRTRMMRPTTNQRLLFLSGPTGVGKTASVRELHLMCGARGRLAVVERDVLAEMGGRQTVALGSLPQGENWRRASRQSLLVVDDFLADGFDTILTSHFREHELRHLRSCYLPYNPLAILLLPTWEVNERRRQSRVDSAVPDHRANLELDLFGWTAHRALYDDQARMARAGQFDLVIDSSDLTPAQVAMRLVDSLRK